MRRLVDVEVVEDRTDRSRLDEGFLRMRRLVLRNRYADGSRSRPYACDVVSRERVDAVALVLWERAGGREVRVLLRTGVRPPLLLRREKHLPHEGPLPVLVAEIVAGVLESDDATPGGIERRAAVEAQEEAGLEVAPAAVAALGGALFPTPGVTDEKVFFRAAEAALDRRAGAGGDGSPMEEGGEVLVLGLREAILRCRDGRIPDMKTEVALLRLADHLGYLPGIDRFVDELPPELRARAAALPPLVPSPRAGPSAPPGPADEDR